MDFLSILGGLFSKTNKYEKEIQENRIKVKERLAQSLQEQCFMTDDEIISVLDVLDECMEAIDACAQKFDFTKDEFRTKNAYESELIKLRKDMLDKVKAKINEIMHLKLEKAKKMFNKE